MSLLSHILRHAPAEALIAFASTFTDYRYVAVSTAPEALPQDNYFGPVLRKTPGDTKADCLGAGTLWADIDTPERPKAVLPPSVVVHSGHGWHFYWMLSHFVTDLAALEQACKTLAIDVGGDSVQNVNRIMRLPGTFNRKETPAVPCVLREEHLDRVYTLEEVMAVGRLSKKVRHKIITGDRRGYASRSERDMAILRALARVGAQEGLVLRLFGHHKCGNKFREANGERYLKHSWETVGRSREKTAGAVYGIVETVAGYAAVRGDTDLRQLSTFIFHPLTLLEGENEDALLGTIKAYGYEWPDILLPRSAFNQTQGLLRYLPKTAWQWLGSDADVRSLLPFLLHQLRAKGLPRVKATHVLGRHEIKGDAYFVTSAGTLSAEALLATHEAPIAYFPLQRVSPTIKVNLELTPPEDLLEILGRLNRPSVIWPILGWWAATPYKPALADINVRFPILNVTGTRGSGKTTTIKSVMMPLFGDVSARTYNATTTRFVLLALLGSTNAVPVALSEYRQAESGDALMRYVLLLYDTGYDPRGRPDRTTEEHALLAPLCIDGEDVVNEPAVRERSLVVSLAPEDVAEGSDAYSALMELSDIELSAAAGPYLQYTLTTDVSELWDEAFDSVHAAFPMRLPDRVRRNIAVAYFGLLSYFRFFDEEPPSVNCMAEVLDHVFAHSRGRAPMAADDFVESVVAVVAQAAKRPPEFFFWYDQEANTLWFNLTSAHKWWQASRRQRLGVSSLGREAIQSQIRQLQTEYMEVPKSVNDFWCYGVRLPDALRLGLDVPAKLDLQAITIYS